MAGPYSTHNIVNVFRSIVQLISQYPELLNTQGIFRIPGSKEEIDRLLEQLICDHFNVETLSHYIMNKNIVNNEHLNNVLGMISTVLKESQILASKDELLVSFSKKLKSLLDSHQEEDLKNTIAAQLFDNFINDLLMSKRIDHQRAGETLYHYFYLMHQVGKCQEINRMTYNNLAIIIAPSLTNELDLYTGNNLLDLTSYVSQFTPILENYIAEAKWDCDFKKYHADKLEHLENTRHSLREQLEHMKEASRKSVTTPMKSFMLQASMIKAQIDAIKEEQQDHSLKKKAKKELGKQLAPLKEEQSDLLSKISELAPQIKVMNRGQRQIQKEIDILTYSGNRVTPRENPSNKSNLAQFSIFESSSSNASTVLSPIPEEKEELEDQEESIHQKQQYP
ncbi:RhoGAP domain protein (GTPase activator of small GTPases) [Legionella santicrucis]|uniref:RhoGAP domain protein (GTPase activator of small GTPases) n=1 Tax=Legionella santicrucis TaxID=45074 RepID=A0A0W0YCR2_9GAMM|nr:Rho GTPase-activating protein [Legionella santicrucis]KTD54685.1 RhoGAP domain protein (GTPase activator of small GTPases) [Legionella santicrucis]